MSKREAKILEDIFDSKAMEVVTVENEKVSESLPSLITKEEFFMTASKSNYIETLGGFHNWLEREGVSSKLPLATWQQMLSEFRHRKV